jgi:SAM-dependent methyltransferase
MSDDQFVASLYRNLLQRQPHTHEVEHWKGILAGGTPRSNVVEVFMSSSEYINLQQQKERFHVSGNLPADASEQEQYVLSSLQTHVVRSQQGVHAEGSKTPAKTVQPSFDVSHLATTTANLWKAQKAVGELNPRNSGLTNRLVQGGKKLLQRSLSWYTRSLQAFNQQAAIAIEEQAQAIASIDSSSQQLREEIRRLENEILKLHSDRFQTTVRAMELATRESLAPYVDFFRKSSPVADLGCGRGEFLELLKENGIPSYGVDSDDEVCAAALRKGLKVFDEDVFDHLSQLPERSLGGIFSARFVEFLPAHLQAQLIGLCAAKLKPGGVLLMETTNPSSQNGYGRISNLDPTHLRPVSPELMVSIFQSSSFSKVKVLAPASVELPLTNNPISASGNGDSPAAYVKPLLTSAAYAVIGWRS